jgi:hypothetical protein
VTSLPAKVHDCPISLALLEMIDSQFGELVTTKPACQKNGK